MRHPISNPGISLFITFAAAGTLLTGCGPAANASGNSLTPSAARIAAHSWIAPASSNSSLLYVARNGVNVVTVFSYPDGKQVGQLTGFEAPWGLCSDQTGNVFVVDAQAQEIFEFAHGGTTPIATLNDAGNAPNGCAVDPSTGNLAVAGGGPFNNIAANIAIFAGAQGTPTVYSNPKAYQYIYCTYDGSGNVFTVDVYTKTGAGVITELANGSGSFNTISLGQPLREGVHAIQWDGTYFAINNPSGASKGPMHIVQAQIHGSKGSVVNTIKLNDSKGLADPIGSQLWIDGTTLAYPESAQSLVGLWHYPTGGKAYKDIKVGVGDVYGLTLSVGK